MVPKAGIINTNIMIENGKIKNLTRSIDNISYTRSIDATGKYILPGLIDPHVHYGVYTSIEKAARTESKSAAIGGVTTMIRMLRLYSDYRSKIEEQITASEKNHIIDYTIHPSILIDSHLEDIPYLINKEGINSFKIYLNLGSHLNSIHMDLNPKEENVRSGIVEITDSFLEKTVQTISSFNGILLVHAEDPEICFKEIKKKIIDKNQYNKNSNQKENLTKENNKDNISVEKNHQLKKQHHHLIKTNSSKKDNNNFQSDTKKEFTSVNIKNSDEVNENESSHEDNQISKEINLLKLWSQCRPYISEVKSIKRVGELGRKYNANIYFVHIGSSDAIDAIIHERERGRCNLYIETCPHYLTHTYDFHDLRGKVVPPLRSKHDVQSIWYALRNGIINTIGTDHVANKLSIKLTSNDDLLETLSGFPGIATMLPVLLNEGVNKGRITLERLAEVTSYNTARIFGLYPHKGTIQKESDADLVIVDLDLQKKVTPELLQSYSDYTIYDGWNLTGWPVTTIVRGEVVMENFLVNESFYGYGKFIPRFK
ncbi:MAG TPA: amidohydrolase family protein [Nitrososphaeraceae archaeon]|nr:amidohydrolase family protein [Nitrososphaeraceae archaeon]